MTELQRKEQNWGREDAAALGQLMANPVMLKALDIVRLRSVPGPAKTATISGRSGADVTALGAAMYFTHSGVQHTIDNLFMLTEDTKEKRKQDSQAKAVDEQPFGYIKGNDAVGAEPYTTH